MIAQTWMIVIIGGIAIVAILITSLVDDWLLHHRQAKLERLRQDLAQTQRRLETLALRHEAWLQEQAHEARKAMILESFRASQEERDASNDERCYE